jgi:hypothetical protein
MHLFAFKKVSGTRADNYFVTIFCFHIFKRIMPSKRGAGKLIILCTEKSNLHLISRAFG